MAIDLRTEAGPRASEMKEAGAGRLAPATRVASLRERLGAKWGIDADSVMTILKNTAFKIKNGEATNSQMAALMAVSDQYGLNPFTREIFAFPDKQNGIVPVVGVDGWSRIINDQDELDGIEFTYSENTVQIDDDAKLCPEWVECTMYRKDRTKPITVREYLDEVYRPIGTYPSGDKMPAGAWQSHTKRMLRHKVLIQCARVAFGFSGIYDEDEAQRIIDVTPTAEREYEEPEKKGGVDKLKQAMNGETDADDDPEGAKLSETEFMRELYECINKVREMPDPDTMAEQINEFPEAVRNDDRFTKAFAARLKEIKESKPAKQSKKKPTVDQQRRELMLAMNKIDSIDDLAGWFGDNVPPELADDDTMQKAYRERLDAIANQMEAERTDK